MALRFTLSRCVSRSRGTALVWLLITMTVMIGFTSFSVDLAGVQVAKLQAQAAADAAALYAAEGVVGGTATSIRNRAVAAAADNIVNGVAVVVDPTQDVEFGTWDATNAIFLSLPTGSETGATAIRVTVHCSASRGSQIPLLFAKIIGVNSADIQEAATASIGQVATSTVNAQACPWLAGMSNGATVAATNGNPTAAVAPTNSPTALTVTGGTQMRFANVSGSSTWNSTSGNGTLDSAGTAGDSSFIATQASANGINSTAAPLNAMMGIFLNDNAPNTTGAAAALDFSTSTSRNFSTLSPALKQVFYIGGGTDSSGALQTFNVPAGATRLFLGTADEYGWWWDNVGSFQFSSVSGNDAVLVH